MKQDAKTWNLLLKVTNTRTGFSEYFTATLNVTTEFTRGWYVLKDEQNETDLDLFLTPVDRQPGQKRENVYSTVNGRRLRGEGGMIDFLSSYMSMATGSLRPTRTLVATSGNDVSFVDVNTLRELRGLDNTLFYQPPQVKSPGFICKGGRAYYLANNGQCHTINTASGNTGRFSAARMKDDENTPYFLSRYFLADVWETPVFFDESSSSFIQGNPSDVVLTAVSDASDTQMPANNTNKKLLFMHTKGSFWGVAIFQDKTDPGLKIISEIWPGQGEMSIYNDTLRQTDKIYNAEKYCLLEGDENIIYFTIGRQIWSRNLSNHFEQLEWTAPQDETITFLRHRKYDQEPAYAFNFVVVGTTSGGNYRLRMFEKPSGSLSPAPAFTLEGKGVARDARYICPLINDYNP